MSCREVAYLHNKGLLPEFIEEEFKAEILDACGYASRFMKSFLILLIWVIIVSFTLDKLYWPFIIFGTIFSFIYAFIFNWFSKFSMNLGRLNKHLPLSDIFSLDFNEVQKKSHNILISASSSVLFREINYGRHSHEADEAREKFREIHSIFRLFSTAKYPLALSAYNKYFSEAENQRERSKKHASMVIRTLMRRE